MDVFNMILYMRFLAKFFGANGATILRLAATIHPLYVALQHILLTR
jgi:hypothetical protein